MSKKIDFSAVPRAKFAELMGLNKSATTRNAANGNIACNHDKTVNCLDPRTRGFVASRTFLRNEPSAERRGKATRLLRRIEAVAGVLPPVPDDIDLDAEPAVSVRSLPVPSSGPDKRLYDAALIAELEITIEKARYARVRADEAELDYQAKARNLAPIGLIKYAFSYPDVFITRTFRTIDEIMPLVEAHIMAGKPRDAVTAIKTRLEAEHKACIIDLVKAVEEEGFHPEAAAEEGRRLGDKLIKDGK